MYYYFINFNECFRILYRSMVYAICNRSNKIYNKAFTRDIKLNTNYNKTIKYDAQMNCLVSQGILLFI